LADRFNESDLFSTELGVEQQTRHTNHPIHGCPDFVAHIGQEGRLGNIGSLGCFLGLIELVICAI